jgi:hypothetical protein
VTQKEVLSEVLDALEALQIPYMVVGSFASNYWGRPRTTHDADLLVDIPRSQVTALAAALEEHFYAPDFAMFEAISRRDHFNAIHIEQAFKVDFWLRTDTSYDLTRFSRRMQATVLGRAAWISTAEDVILMKLLWYRDSEMSGPQLLDATGVYEVQAGHLDQSYLDRWAGELGLKGLLAAVRSAAARPAPG